MKLEKEKKYWLWCGQKNGKPIQAIFLFDNGTDYVFTCDGHLFKTPKDEIDLVCCEQTESRCITKKIQALRAQSQEIMEAFHKSEHKYFEKEDKDGWLKAYNSMKREVGAIAREIERLKEMRRIARRKRQ